MSADPFAEALRAAGVRRTEAREAVLRVLQGRGEPLTHADLSTDPQVAGMDPVTLYRTLATLEGAGLVHRVQGIDGAWRYCPHRAEDGDCPGNHAHFLCTACGSMTCLVDQPMPHVQVPDGAVVAARHLVAWGLCPRCAASGGAPP